MQRATKDATNEVVPTNNCNNIPAYPACEIPPAYYSQSECLWQNLCLPCGLQRVPPIVMAIVQGRVAEADESAWLMTIYLVLWSH